MKGLWQKIRGLWRDETVSANPKLPKAATLLLSDLAKKKKVPGIAVSVYHRGNMLLQGGWGYADIEGKIPMDPVETRTRAASASKPIAAMALGKLIASNQMAWDTSYYDYVPYFPKKQYDFSIRQLASHTAGIRGYKGKEYALNKPFSIRDSLTVFQNDPLLFPPGTSYHYNSFDWVMLSLAIEEVTGMSFEAHVQKEILDPLGLRQTRPEVPGEADPSIAKFYTRTKSGFREAIPVDNRYKLAGGGYLTTAAELARFGKACLEYKILDPASMGEIWKAQNINGQSTYYGLGWEVSEDGHGRPCYGHRGNSVGAYTNFYLYPKQDVVFVVLINCTDPGVQPSLDEVRNLILTEQE